MVAAAAAAVAATAAACAWSWACVRVCGSACKHACKHASAHVRGQGPSSIVRERGVQANWAHGPHIHRACERARVQQAGASSTCLCVCCCCLTCSPFDSNTARAWQSAGNRANLRESTGEPISQCRVRCRALQKAAAARKDPIVGPATRPHPTRHLPVPEAESRQARWSAMCPTCADSLCTTSTGTSGERTHPSTRTHTCTRVSLRVPARSNTCMAARASTCESCGGRCLLRDVARAGAACARMLL